MPTYDYVCATCGNEIEVMHSVHADGPTICPKCGGQVKKTFAAPAVHYKGSGWARKERSSTGKPARVDRKDENSSSSGGPEPSAGDSGSPSGTDGPAKEAPAKDAPAKDPD